MKRYLFTFTVRGDFRFPLDMLRYDACYPMSQQDVARIQESVEHSSPGQVVCLATWQSKKWKPSTERWQSFGWTVSDVVEDGGSR